MPKLFSLLILLACSSTLALGENGITGSVHNQSLGQPAVGDEVILVRLDRDMQQEARTVTNTQGAFALNVRFPDRPYLVRVFHQGVSYDQQATAGEILSIQVFDAASRVQGVTGTIEILRAGTNGNLLHVSDMVEIKNASSPPLTQAGERTFDVYLPPHARIDSVLAAGPGKIGVMISATPLPGEPGHYTVSFPLRPGATKFAFNYDVPYDGRAAFRTKHSYPLQQMAVMIPPTMKFSSPSPAFQTLPAGNIHYQVQATNQLKAGQGPAFEVSGTGDLPPLDEQNKTQAHSTASPNPTSSSPGGAVLPGLASIDSRPEQTQPRSESLVLGSMTSVLLAACVLLVWRTRKARNLSAAQTVTARPPKAILHNSKRDTKKPS